MKKIFTIFFVCLLLCFSPRAYAGTASDVADKAITYTAKGAYYLTKYTLKAGWFVIKKTAKCVVVVSKSIYSGSKDAFAVSKQDASVSKPNNVYTLPPAPKL